MRGVKKEGQEGSCCNKDCTRCMFVLEVFSFETFLREDKRQATKMSMRKHHAEDGESTQHQKQQGKQHGQGQRSRSES